MTTDHDARTRTVVSWLREDAHENAERVLLAALNDIDHTQQRRSWWPARRFPAMNTFAKALLRRPLWWPSRSWASTCFREVGVEQAVSHPRPRSVRLSHPRPRSVRPRCRRETDRR
jgi:hypothetical protein